jgi:hypothetical protein
MERGGKGRHGDPNVGDTHLGRIGTEWSLAQERGRAGAHRVGRVPMTIGRGAPDAAKERTGADAARIVRDGGDRRAVVAGRERAIRRTGEERSGCGEKGPKADGHWVPAVRAAEMAGRVVVGVFGTAFVVVVAFVVVGGLVVVAFVVVDTFVVVVAFVVVVGLGVVVVVVVAGGGGPRMTSAAGALTPWGSARTRSLLDTGVAASRSGGMRSCRTANAAISAKTGAAVRPPVERWSTGSSSTTMIDSCGFDAGRYPAKLTT